MRIPTRRICTSSFVVLRFGKEAKRFSRSRVFTNIKQLQNPRFSQLKMALAETHSFRDNY